MFSNFQIKFIRIYQFKTFYNRVSALVYQSRQMTHNRKILGSNPTRVEILFPYARYMDQDNLVSNSTGPKMCSLFMHQWQVDGKSDDRT